MALPSGKRSRVKSIVTYDGELDEAFSPMAVTVTLDDEIDVSRGDMLVHPGNLPHVSSAGRGDGRLDGGEALRRRARRYWVKQTTRTVAGEIAELRYGVDVNTLEKRPATQLAMNEVGHVLLSLNQPIAYDPYKINAATGAFILIDRLTNNTVGAGMILEPRRPRRRRRPLGPGARQRPPQAPPQRQVTPGRARAALRPEGRHHPPHRPDRLGQGDASPTRWKNGCSTRAGP